MQDSITERKRALEIDPLSVVGNASLGLAFYLARQHDQAIEQERKTLELDPNFTLAHAILGFAYVQKSMPKEAIAEFEKPLAISPTEPTALPGLGYAYAMAGKRIEAQKILDKLGEISEQRYVPAWSRAVVYVGLGDKNKAFDWIEKAYEERSAATGLANLKFGPPFDPLRSDSRFADLLRRMNLQ